MLMHDAIQAKNDARKASKSPKVLRSLSVTKSENGGHVVEHHFEQSGSVYHDSESHVFGKGEGKQMLAHVAKHMDISGGNEREKADEHEGEGTEEEKA